MISHSGTAGSDLASATIICGAKTSPAFESRARPPASCKWISGPASTTMRFIGQVSHAAPRRCPPIVAAQEVDSETLEHTLSQPVVRLRQRFRTGRYEQCCQSQPPVDQAFGSVASSCGQCASKTHQIKHFPERQAGLLL